MKAILTLIREIVGKYLTEGESIIHNDDHLTLKAADGKTYRIDVTEVSDEG